MKWIRNF